MPPSVATPDVDINDLLRDVEVMEDESFVFPRRSWKRNKAIETMMTGSIVKSSRLFGIELEADYALNSQIRWLEKYIHSDIGIHQDAGAEFQVPPTRGKIGEDIINDLADKMKKIGLRSRNGCGLHVHIDCSDFSKEEIRTLWLLHKAAGDVMFNLINSYRKTSTWCQKTPQNFDQIKNAENIEELFYQTKDKSSISYYKGGLKNFGRYGFNLQALLSSGHVEIRYYQSTLDPKEILEWVNLQCLMVDAAKNGIPIEELEKLNNAAWVRTQKRLLFEMIDLPKKSKDYWLKK